MNADDESQSPCSETTRYPLALLQDAWEAAFAASMKSPQQFSDAWLRISSEWLSFVSQRFAAQAGLMSCLQQCQDVDAVVTAEARFIEDAADQYVQEYERLTSVAQESTETPGVTAPKARQPLQPPMAA